MSKTRDRLQQKIKEAMQGTIAHVVPFGGEEPHHIAGHKCWCHPILVDGKYIHNAADCRESYERIYGKTRSKEEVWKIIYAPL